MTPFRVKITASVLARIGDQLRYIAQDSVDNALAWEDRLRSTIHRIGDAPHGYAVDEAASDRIGRSVRKLVFERVYLVFYQLDERKRIVKVVHFRHGARSPRPGEA